MKSELKRIDGWSAIKIVFILFFMVGAVVGSSSAFFLALINSFSGGLIGSAASGLARNSISAFTFIFYFAAITAVISAFTILGFVLSYNLLATWIGGLKLEISSPNQEAKTQPTRVIEVSLPEEV